MNFLSGIRVLEEVESPINGKIQVIKSLAFGTYIQVDGLTQSGGVITDVWRTTLKKVKGQMSNVKSCLILGLGGGSAAGLVKKYWPDAKITGVELDPIMTGLGDKYLGLGELGVKVIVDDAYDYLIHNSKFKIQNDKSKLKKFDLILNDVYVGHEIPQNLESDNYIQRVRTVLARDGIAVFNRLYYGEKRAQAVRFGKKLQKHFSKVDAVYPEANVMYICKL